MERARDIGMTKDRETAREREREREGLKRGENAQGGECPGKKKQLI